MTTTFISAHVEVDLARAQADQLSVARAAAAHPGLDVLGAPRLAEVADREALDDLLAPRLGQHLDGGVSDRRDDEVRPLGGRDRQGGTSIARERASLVGARRARHDQVVALALEPDREHVRVAVQADEAELPDDRPAQELVRPRVQSAVILGGSNVRAVDARAKVKLLTDSDVPFR